MELLVITSSFVMILLSPLKQEGCIWIKTELKKKSYINGHAKIQQKTGLHAIFSPVIKDAGSYYEKVENREYLREYEPETAVDIKQELSSLWGKDRFGDKVFEQIQTVCTIACMKNENEAVHDEQVIHNKEQLKPYIYHY